LAPTGSVISDGTNGGVSNGAGSPGSITISYYS
jgi:hypothetical protein